LGCAQRFLSDVAVLRRILIAGSNLSFSVKALTGEIFVVFALISLLSLDTRAQGSGSKAISVQKL
jgi:hypothetical protein